MSFDLPGRNIYYYKCISGKKICILFIIHYQNHYHRECLFSLVQVEVTISTPLDGIGLLRNLIRALLISFVLDYAFLFPKIYEVL